MATGNKPFTGTNVVTTLHAVMNQKPASPKQINPAVPAELEIIIGRSMEKDRVKRYQNVAEMKADLQRLRKETESGLIRSKQLATPKMATRTFQKTSSKQIWVTLALAALLLTVLIAVGAWWVRSRGAA